LWHPSKFQRVSRLGFFIAAMSLTGGQRNFARCLAVSWAGALYILFGTLVPKGILTGTILTLRPSLAFSYIFSVSARHSSSGHQPNFAAWCLHAKGLPSRSTLDGRTIQFKNRLHRHRAWMIQWYSPGGASVQPHLIRAS